MAFLMPLNVWDKNCLFLQRVQLMVLDGNKKSRNNSSVFSFFRNSIIQASLRVIDREMVCESAEVPRAHIQGSGMTS